MYHGPWLVGWHSCIFPEQVVKKNRKIKQWKLYHDRLTFHCFTDNRMHSWCSVQLDLRCLTTMKWNTTGDPDSTTRAFTKQKTLLFSPSVPTMIKQIWVKRVILSWALYWINLSCRLYFICKSYFGLIHSSPYLS